MKQPRIKYGNEQQKYQWEHKLQSLQTYFLQDHLSNIYINCQ
uniref:Uncharacterized protein n=1 Tax=Arundo donax TaxID=35708 RepID=A0A0A9HRJ8_ARUDO